LSTLAKKAKAQTENLVKTSHPHSLINIIWCNPHKIGTDRKCYPLLPFLDLPHYIDPPSFLHTPTLYFSFISAFNCEWQLTDPYFFVIFLNFPAKFPSLEIQQPEGAFLLKTCEKMRILCSVFKTTNIWPRENRKQAQDRPSLGGCVRTINQTRKMGKIQS